MQPSHDTPRDMASATQAHRPALAVIAAVAANAVIGGGNRLPWHLAPDLKRFRALTTGHAVIMGRRTWESIGHPLPGRQNIVVTRQRVFGISAAETACSLEAALGLVRMPAPAFCIGGGELYRQALPLATTLYLTEITRAFDGDTTFPPFDRRDWRETSRETHVDQEQGLDYAFVTYARAR
jgi:dihydrofolate reductase